METYSLLREIADSWMLLLMFGFFIGVIIWAFRPSGRKIYPDTADIPFRNDDKPAPSADIKEEQQQ